MDDKYVPRDPPPPYSEYVPNPTGNQQPPSAPFAQPYTTYGTTGYSTTIICSEPEVIIVGGCPACRIGVLEDDYTCPGLLCAILFFPLGILCCLLLKEKRCQNCGASFG